MAKTTKELRYDELFMEYKVLHKIDSSSADERFKQLFEAKVQVCAEKLYGGDVEHPVLHKSLYNNLVSDKRSRFKKVDEYYGYLPDANLRKQLVDLIDTLLPAEYRRKKRTTGDISRPDKAYWMYSEDDIREIESVDTLNKFFNGLATEKSRASEKNMDFLGLDSLEEVRSHFDRLREVGRQHKEALEKPRLSNSLQDKLDKGKSVTLSQAELEELRKLLG